MKVFPSLVFNLLTVVVAVSSANYGYKYENNPYSGECRLQLNLPGYGDKVPPRRYGSPHPKICHPSPAPPYRGSAANRNQPSVLAPRRPPLVVRPVSQLPPPPVVRPVSRLPPPPPRSVPRRYPPVVPSNPTYAPPVIRRPRPPAAVNYGNPPVNNYAGSRPPPPRRNYRPAPAPIVPSVPIVPTETSYEPSPVVYPAAPEDYIPATGTYGNVEPQPDYVGDDYSPPGVVSPVEADVGFDGPGAYEDVGDYVDPRENYVDPAYDPAPIGTYDDNGVGYAGVGAGGGLGGLGGVGGVGAGNYGGVGGVGAGNYGGGAGRGAAAGGNYGGGAGRGAGGRYNNNYKKKK